MSTTPPPPTTQAEGGDETASQAPPRPARANPARLAVAAGLLVLLAVAALFAFEWMRTTEANRAIVVVVALAIGTVGVFALYLLLDRFADALPSDWQETVRPWMYVGPALILLAIFLLYPAIRTIILSFQGPRGDTWVGADNFARIWTDESLRRSVRNTLAWMVVVPGLAVGIGLVFATLADRLERGESLAKSLIFLPMAISFVGASVVWAFIY
ncbi:MAG: sugar ABC transporter permease, partial [Egicoccus sp.]